MKINKRTKIFLIISLIIMGGFVATGYACFKVFQMLQQKRQSIDILLAQEEINSEKITKKDIFASQYDFVREKEIFLQGVFIQKEELVSTIRELESLAQLAGVSVQLNIQESVVKKQKPKSTTAVKEDAKKTSDDQGKDKIVFLIDIQGSYEDTIRYILHLEKMHPVASFESITMKKEDSEKENDTSFDKDSPLVEKKILTAISVSFAQFLNQKK